MAQALTELLSRYKISKTEPRLKVLSILKTRNIAVSQPELEEILGKEIDRVTLYRTLGKFEEKGIIHKIIDFNGTAKYALCCSEIEAPEHLSHNDDHVHFNCTSCLNVYCLEALQIPHLVIPKGFTSKTVNFIVYGICDHCNGNPKAHIHSNSAAKRCNS